MDRVSRVVGRKVSGLSQIVPPWLARFGREAARAEQWHLTRPGGRKLYHATMSGMGASHESRISFVGELA